MHNSKFFQKERKEHIRKSMYQNEKKIVKQKDKFQVYMYLHLVLN